MNKQRTLMLSGVLGALGILIGAFGAHALPQILAGLDADALNQREEWLRRGLPITCITR